MQQTKIIDGKKRAEQIRADLKKQVVQFERAPKLAVVLVGNNPASQIYVRHKMKMAQEVGINVDLIHLPDNIQQEELMSLIQNLNRDEGVDGMIVQLPLPRQLDPNPVLESIDPNKDVDGLCSVNLGHLFVDEEGLCPCTPLACMDLIRSVCPNLKGKNAVVVGRSRLVGKPVTQLLLNADCTVTQAHSYTQDLAAICRTADVLVVAAGHPNLIGKEHIKPGAIVIDVGINRGRDNQICGDVNFDEVFPVAGAITPVPGGVGPMTVAMLLNNVVKIYVKKKEAEKA